MSAKQEGIIPIRGTVGNLTFFKTPGGSYRVRQRSKVDKHTLETAPNYKRVRETITEFSAANKGASLFRKAAIEMAKRFGDPSLYRRLLQIMMRLLQSDTTHLRGSRTIADGDISRLKTFRFGGRPLNGSFASQYKTLVNRKTGKFFVEVAEINTDRDVFCSAGSTHFQLHALGMAIDFHTGLYSMNLKSSEYYPCHNATVPYSVLETSIPSNSTGHLFLLFGIEFFVETNGVMYELNNKMDNAMEVVEASKD